MESHYRKKRRQATDRLPENLPVEVVEHRLLAGWGGYLHTDGYHCGMQKEPAGQRVPAGGKTGVAGKKLSGALADLLVDKVVVYPGDKIEVVWKLEGFLNGLAQEAQPFVAP